MDSVLEEWYILDVKMIWADFTKHSDAICCMRALEASAMAAGALPLPFYSMQDVTASAGSTNAHVTLLCKLSAMLFLKDCPQYRSTSFPC